MSASSPSLAGRERAQLADLLDKLGPDAPTCCAGWTTAHLAAHVVVRDRRPDALLGFGIEEALGDGPLPSWAHRLERRLRESTPFPDVVARLRSGAAIWSPLSWPGLRSFDVPELAIHHEDVRRAQPRWEPREVAPELANAVWARLRMVGRMLFRRAPVGVRLQRLGEDRPPIRVRPGTPEVTVTGEPVELALFAFNRRDVSRVTFEGDADAINRLRLSTLGP
jgi:uncharacterized protein (TIGR03085 family)